MVLSVGFAEVLDYFKFLIESKITENRVFNNK